MTAVRIDSPDLSIEAIQEGIRSIGTAYGLAARDMELELTYEQLDLLVGNFDFTARRVRASVLSSSPREELADFLGIDRVTISDRDPRYVRSDITS